VTEAVRTYSLWFGALCLALAAFVYLDNTGSEHAATNPDELLYLQIARLTAETGHWLPLQATEVKHRNTKPPGLFWQGIATTGWGSQWELWRLRLPNALFSVLTAAMAFFVARKLGGSFSAGTVAALSSSESIATGASFSPRRRKHFGSSCHFSSFSCFGRRGSPGHRASASA
jgi:4-amino-4-deoxy-L-arabinose transferase-like glycosyltransferase